MFLYLFSIQGVDNSNKQGVPESIIYMWVYCVLSFVLYFYYLVSRCGHFTQAGCSCWVLCTRELIVYVYLAFKVWNFSHKQSVPVEHCVHVSWLYIVVCVYNLVAYLVFQVWRFCTDRVFLWNIVYKLASWFFVICICNLVI